MDALRRDIGELTSLLATLEHCRQEKIDIATYGPEHGRQDCSDFLQSVAKVLSTTDMAVAVSGGLMRSNGHLQLVVATEEEQCSPDELMPNSRASTPCSEESNTTLVEQPEDPKKWVKVLSQSSASLDSLSCFVRRHLSLSKLADRDARCDLILARAAEVRQKIIAGDTIFPYHSAGFREIFMEWTASDEERDDVLLPDGAFSCPIRPSIGQTISQFVENVWDPRTKTVAFTDANVPKWINGLGLLLGFAYLTFAHPSHDPQSLFALLETIQFFKETLASRPMRGVFNKSSLSDQLRTCMGGSHAIDIEDSSVHEFYPIPDCMQHLVVSYLDGIIDIATHAANIFQHRHSYAAPNAKDITVDIVHLNTSDPLSRPESTMEEVLRRYILDVRTKEPWFRARRGRLSAYVSVSVHPEAALLCLRRASLNAAPGQRPEDAMEWRAAGVVADACWAGDIGMSRKMCYCCGVVDMISKLEDPCGSQPLRMDPAAIHGRITPWLPPAYGLSMEWLEELKRDLVMALHVLVGHLREDDRMAIQLFKQSKLKLAA